MKSLLSVMLLVSSILYLFWTEISLNRHLEEGRLWLSAQKEITVSIVEILQDSPARVSCRGQLQNLSASILVKFPGGTPIHIGDTLTILGRVMPEAPENLRNFYRLKHIAATVEVATILNNESHFSFPGYFYSLKKSFSQFLLNTLNYDSGAFLSGILWGDTDALSPGIKKSFQETGLSHMMAISGANMLFIAQLLAVLLFFLPVRIRIVVTIISLLFFSALVGMSAAVLRAGIMAVIANISSWLGRKYWSSRAFYLVLFAFFIYDPLIVLYDIGFQLSCAATAGMIFLQPLLRSYLVFLPWQSLKDLIATTLIASIVTLPVTLYYFSVWYPLSIGINILLMPLIGFVSIVAYLGFFLLLLPGIQEVVAFTVSNGIEGVLSLIKILAVISSRVVVIFSMPLWLLFFYYAVLTFLGSCLQGGGITSKVK